MSRSADDNGAVFVTGAASGIGLAAARMLAERGRPVALMDRDAQACARAAETLRSGGAAALDLAVDVIDEDDVARAFDAAAEHLGPPAGLVTAAGIDRGGRAHELDVATWDLLMSVNLRGTFMACRRALGYMMGRGGAIVCVSSPFARVSAPGVTAYASTKAGVGALVRSLAVDYAADGVRVNAVLPGPTETPLMWAAVEPREIPRMREVIAHEVPLGRLADPVEPARAIAWLLSADASYVTGTELTCDGGLLAKAAISV